MTDCLFCKIVNGEIASHLLFEDDEVKRGKIYDNAGRPRDWTVTVTPSCRARPIGRSTPRRYGTESSGVKKSV